MSADETIVRDERESDHEAVWQVHRLAFSSDAEARLVDELRASGKAAISLVAERAGAVVGHILFSPLEAPVASLSLAPVGVLPDAQKQDIGSALIRMGLERARIVGWSAVFVVGDPNYYSRFGFDADRAEAYASPYSGPHFMVLSLGTSSLPPAGPVVYPEPFAALG